MSTKGTCQHCAEWPEIPVAFIGPSKIQLKDDAYLHGCLIPKGFISDGGSVPVAFHFVAKPFGAGLKSFLPHDWMYVREGLPIARKQADILLYENLRRDGFGWLRAKTVYRAVRMFGWRHWKA